MTKYILAGGYIVRGSPDGGKAFCDELVKGIDKKPIKILDCMFARPSDSWEDKLKEDNDFFSKHVSDFTLELADPLKFTEQVKNSDVIFLRGGFILPLMEILNNDISWIKELKGKVVAGTSAGAATIARYYYVGTTSRIGNGLNLLPIKFIAHWKSENPKYSEKKIDWNRALRSMKEHKENIELVTLQEGEFKIFIN